jgi:hypothetical protein
MCEYLKFETENWNLYVKRLEFENFKTKMSEFGHVNIVSCKLKTDNWNLFVKCLKGISNFENYNVRILKTKNWNVWILKSKNWNV